MLGAAGRILGAAVATAVSLTAIVGAAAATYAAAATVARAIADSLAATVGATAHVGYRVVPHAHGLFRSAGAAGHILPAAAATADMAAVVAAAAAVAAAIAAAAPGILRRPVLRHRTLGIFLKIQD